MCLFKNPLDLNFFVQIWQGYTVRGCPSGPIITARLKKIRKLCHLARFLKDFTAKALKLADIQCENYTSGIKSYMIKLTLRAIYDKVAL